MIIIIMKIIKIMALSMHVLVIPPPQGEAIVKYETFNLAF